MADDNTSSEKHIENTSDKPWLWKEGQSGNPNGRPKKGTALTDLMRKMMEEQPDIKKAIIARLLKGAAEGDIAFIREVLDRTEGKAIQTNELTGENGQPITIMAARGFIPAGTPVVTSSVQGDAGQPSTVQDDSVASKG